MYIDAKHHIVKDINSRRAKRRFKGVVTEDSILMEDYYTLYHAIELNDPKAEAFWFEVEVGLLRMLVGEADKLAQLFLDQ
jgi:hypothetical protein